MLILWLSSDPRANSPCKVGENCQGWKERANESSNRKSESSHLAVNRQQHHHKYQDTLPFGEYHIQLKEDYRPVQHPLWHVAVSLKLSYRAELDRLLKLGIITEIKELTGWFNPIASVKKLGGSLRLLLDPKNLNKNIKKNWWYSKTIDDILQELQGSALFTLLDAKSGCWHVILNREGSLWPHLIAYGANSDGYEYHLDSKWQEMSSKRDLTEYSETSQMSTALQ